MTPPTPTAHPAPTRDSLLEETGFTLIELVIVLLIIGILVSIAVPSYLGLKERADKSAAQTNVRAAVSDTEAYYADNGTFNGISPTVLKSTYDTTLDLSIIDVQSKSSGSSFMLCSKSNSWYAYKDGPAAVIATSTTQPDHCSL